ncbi:site-specific DNA-methyltransferase [Rhodohalobacter halophilus]|uniref:site-specific DNA-methyltransferase n=1 Tax=Rhodohalobacter halophilus TaxID=1812810 RepID=UPI00083FAC2A|nr:site-specific DNA-methyltransferase [Rhodohalobacter halophilus]
MTENQQARQKLQDELRKLFQFEVSDLDFGIYRILNRKKDRIEEFIEKDLLDAVNKGLEAYQQQDASQVDDIKQQIMENLSDDAFDEQGNLVKYENTKLGKDYLEALEKAEKQEVGADTEKKIYNDLFTFFSRYYDNGDFLSKRRISTRDSKYAVPYNGEEVLLHWANKDQYYIKSGEQFTSFKFELEGGKKAVWFKVAQAETDRDNVKEEEDRSFVLRPDNPIEVNDNELTLWFEYRPLTDEEEKKWLDIYKKVEKPRKTVDRSVLCVAYNEFVLNEVDKEWRDLLSVIPKNKDRSLLYQKLNHYTGKNTTDYFIHKDLKSFLERELEYYLKNEVIRVDDFIEDQSQQAMEVALTRAKVVRQIGKKIIAFLSQIENFQKKLFEKKKFVVDTHYCFTLDMIPEDLYDTILENEDQLKSWESLYAMDKWDGELQWDGKWTKEFLKEHPFMMVDTKFFGEDFKFDLLNSINDLDQLLKGNLLKGENYQVVNLMINKYKGNVNTVYLDPPYNTGNDGFLYKDRFFHSSWLTMMENRLCSLKKMFQSDGNIFISIDENELNNLEQLSKQVFGEDNYLGNLIWKSRQNKDNRNISNISIDHEYIVSLGSKVRGDTRNLEQYSNPDNDPRGDWTSANMVGLLPEEERPNCHFDLINPETGINYGKPEMGWRYDQNTMNKLIEENKILWPAEPTGRPRRKKFVSELQNEFTGYSSIIADNIYTRDGTVELDNLFGKRTSNFPKPSDLVKELIEQSSIEKKVVLDFFAGTGTTAHSCIKLNNIDANYILVEIGNQFQSIIIPRIKKVVCSNNWKGGVPQDQDGQSHSFKYHFIESYEDALNNIEFKNPEDTQQAMEFEDYMLNYMLDFETQGVSATLLKDEAFDTPFDYQLNIQRGHGSPKPETVDMVETFHYLIGLWVQTLRRYEHQSRKYVVSKGQIRDEDAVEDVCIIWRNTKDLDLDKEAEWIQENITKDETFDRIYINGINKVKDAEPIELTFREKMFEDIA